jgi:hypothetical protein
MEILTVEKFRLSVFYPVCAGERLTLRAMTFPAGRVADTWLTACITLFDLSSESRRTAYLVGGHDASLRCGHPLTKRRHGGSFARMKYAASSGFILTQKSSAEKNCVQGSLTLRCATQ